jgi:general secretion pathway protein D
MGLEAVGRIGGRAVGALRVITGCAIAAGLLLGRTSTGVAQDTTAVRVVNDSLVIRFVEADIRAVIQLLGRYLAKPILVGAIPPAHITFETPAPIPREQVPAILRGLVRSNSHELVEDSAFYRVGPVQAGPPQPQGAGPGAGQAQAPVRLFVIRLKHARAADVAATVNLLFGGSGAFAGSGGLTTGTLSDELRRTAEQTMQPPTPGQPQAPSQQVGPRATLTGPVTIIPDELTNSLLIRASEQDFEVIRQAVEQVDVRPLQVLIQVLIVEVRRDRALSLGTDVTAKDLPLDGDATLSAFLLGGGLGNIVLQVMNLGPYDIEAALRAAVSRGDARIVSRPVVVASNNREARILVGAQRPFVQVSRSLPTDAPSRDQVVQYRDVGTKLTVIPTINEDGYVSLVIRQEVNSATAETQFDAPVIATREAETQLLVRDSQTVVLGGLRERQHEVTKSGIPILSSVPLLGGLFGFQSRRTTETELFLFITPRVLRDNASADSAATRALQDVEGAGVRVPRREQP